MRKLFWILSALVSLSAFIILVIALTNNSPENPFKEYRIVIVVGFFAITGIIRFCYNKFYKADHENSNSI